MQIEAIYIYDGNGNVTITDERVFSDCKEFALQQLRKQAMEKILEVAPEFKQRNAALGLLSEEETNILKLNIQNIRNLSNQKENEILGIVWDGTEETRSSACDLVLSIIL
jgi:hypothetical protein